MNSSSKLNSKAFTQTLMLLKFNAIDRQNFYNELYHCGVSSTFIIALCGSFIGIVLTIQGIWTLEQFGANGKIGQFITLAILRELGPVTTALLFSGNVCTATTSEIAVMKLTEQTHALKSIGINVYRFCYLPKMFATTISATLLFNIFSIFSIAGSFGTATLYFHMDSGSYWASIKNSLMPDDYYSGLLKIFVFAIAINLTAILFGINARQSSTGIARSTTQCVITASILIFALDLILTYILMKTTWLWRPML
ncbi:MAG: ABC transporter permease [Pseudomonadota bacterium]|nr:ABC transporter permease [Pseudomonadota bacterium]